jgi:hypothetical protein
MAAPENMAVSVERLAGSIIPEAWILRFRGPTATGSMSAVAPVDTMAKNAVVEKYGVTVTLSGNTWIAVAGVGQTRKTALPSMSGVSLLAVVVDFGSLVTVDAVAVVGDVPYRCYRVTPWNGSRFDIWSNVYRAGYTGSADNDVPPTATVTPSGTSDAITSFFQSEVRTERLQVELVADASAKTPTDADLFANVLVHCPGAPADLELRLNGGPPLWSHPGPVSFTDPVTGSAPSSGPNSPPASTTWTIDAAPAVNALVGDPAADPGASVDLQFTLTARQPGALTFALAGGSLDTGRQVSFVQSVPDIGPDGALDVIYPDEGLGPALTLLLPAEATTVEEARFDLFGVLPPERALPPTGPGDDAKAAWLVLDGTHAACALYAPAVGNATPAFREVTGVRLPLHAEPGGADVRVQLWTAVNFEPGAPIDSAVSKPVAIAGASESDGFDFVTFNFAKPVPIPEGGAFYVAALVGRGKVRWSFAQPSGDPSSADPPSRIEVRVGPPAGPWRDLPGPFDTGNELGTLGGRLRVIGRPPPDAPLAPLAIGLATETQRFDALASVTPTAKGVAVAVAVPEKQTLAVGADRKLAVRVLRYVAGKVTVKNLQVRFKTDEAGTKLPGKTTRG